MDRSFLFYDTSSWLCETPCPPPVNTHFSHAIDRDTPSARRHCAHHIKLYYVPLFDQGTNMHMTLPRISEASPQMTIKDSRLARALFRVLHLSVAQAKVRSLKER